MYFFIMNEILKLTLRLICQFRPPGYLFLTTWDSTSSFGDSALLLKSKISIRLYRYREIQSFIPWHKIVVSLCEPGRRMDWLCIEFSWWIIYKSSCRIIQMNYNSGESESCSERWIAIFSDILLFDLDRDVRCEKGIGFL